MDRHFVSKSLIPPAKPLDNAKLLDIPWASEVISERFDGILELLSEGSFVFGGALRDIVAQQPLKGDLDIVATRSNYKELTAKLVNSPKWQSDSPRVQNKPRRSIGGFAMPDSSPKHNYRGTPLKTMMVFTDVDGCKVQVMTVDSKKEPKDMAREVDLRCCGFVMDHNAQIFELIDGAVEDCNQKILTLNEVGKYCSNLDLAKERISKLVKRGWKSEVNLDLLGIVITKKLAKEDEKDRDIRSGMFNTDFLTEPIMAGKRSGKKVKQHHVAPPELRLIEEIIDHVNQEGDMLSTDYAEFIRKRMPRAAQRYLLSEMMSRIPGVVRDYLNSSLPSRQVTLMAIKTGGGRVSIPSSVIIEAQKWYKRRVGRSKQKSGINKTRGLSVSGGTTTTTWSHTVSDSTSNTW